MAIIAISVLGGFVLGYIVAKSKYHDDDFDPTHNSMDL